VLFYETIYYNPQYEGCPSHSKEEILRGVGVVTSVGDSLTFKILTPSKQVIFQSVIPSALDLTLCNMHLALLDREKDTNHLGNEIFF
jgi:hypothetical protein